MFEIDENSLPFVRTRQALLLLDLQNDFVSTDGILPVNEPANFLDKIFRLLPEFRPSGNIIWVRTVFEESRAVNEPIGNSESVITDNELPRDRSGGTRLRTRPSQRLLERHQRIAGENGITLDFDAAIEADEEGEATEVEETYLTLGPNQEPQAVLPASPGTNFSPEASSRIDAKKDLVFQKTWYSAFKDESLVQILRAKFVTEIYLCGALSNISVFATAMDAARHGYTITIVEDCLGYRSKARHDEALRRLVEFAGCDIISSDELIENLQQKAIKLRQTTTPPKRSQYQRPQAKLKAKASNSSTGPEIDNLMANLSLRPDGSSTAGHRAIATGSQGRHAEARTESADSSPNQPSEALEWSPSTKSTDVDGKKKDRVKSKIKTRRRHSRSTPKEVGESSSAKAPDQKSPSPASQVLSKLPNSSPSEQEQATTTSPPAIDPLDTFTVRSRHSEIETTPAAMTSNSQDGSTNSATSITYCEGDTSIIHNLLDEKAAEGIFERLRDEVRWQRMTHQGGDVPRLVAVQGEIDEDGSIPIYRHPADESPPLLPFSPTVELIRKAAEKQLGHSLNHVLIQFYRDSTDHITEHSDKTLDIVKNTFICNVSLGARRTMTFRTKRPPKSTAAAAAEPEPRQVQRVLLPHNSMCKVGLVTNMRWLHAIRPDKRMDSEKSPEELAYDCGRISLTFRLIGTFLSKDEKKIWGQGAVSKTKAKAGSVINGDAVESERMIRAFSKENFASEFDWQGVYGPGFDVLHISNWPKLIVSGETVTDLRVKTMLSEYGITWLETKSSTVFNWKDSKIAEPVTGEPIKFIDDDDAQSTVTGDIATILYLSSIHGPKSKNPTPGPDLAKQFTRLQQSSELLKKWHSEPFDLNTFCAELEIWDSFAKDGPYIAGPEISIADFAFWPVLEVSRQKWKTIEGLDHIANYYNLLRDRETFVKVLGAREAAVKAPE